MTHVSLLRDPHGPLRAQRRYLAAVDEIAAAFESELTTLDEQLVDMEQRCGFPPRATRAIEPDLPDDLQPEKLSSGILSGSSSTAAASAAAVAATGVASTGSSSSSGGPRALTKGIGTAKAKAIPPKGTQKNAHKKTAKEKALAKMFVSPRYGKVIGRLLNPRSGVKAKIKKKAGVYDDTLGLYRQKEYREAMQKPPDDLKRAMLLTHRNVMAWDQRSVPPQPMQYTRPDGSKGELAFILQATREASERWTLWLEWSEENFFKFTKRPDPRHPFPVFIPTKGRASDAHLNWSASHCFGPAADPRHKSEAEEEADDDDVLGPLVIAVVEPGEAAAYRAAWPQLSLLVLPEDDMGVSFARWAVQRFATASREVGENGELGPLRRLPFCWMCDDNITCFYRLDELPAEFIKTVERPGMLGKIIGRNKMRALKGPMFAEAFCESQKKALMAPWALCGFLRDDGTSTTKKADWSSSSTSLFKVVLLNLQELWRMQVEYIPELQLFEDVSLCVQVKNAGGRLLKSLRYCYWADKKTTGGCSNQRFRRAQENRCTALNDLVGKEQSLATMSSDSRRAVEEVFDWVRKNEVSSHRKQLAEQLKSRLSQGGARARPGQPPAHGDGRDAKRGRKAIERPTQSNIESEEAGNTGKMVQRGTAGAPGQAPTHSGSALASSSSSSSGAFAPAPPKLPPVLPKFGLSMSTTRLQIELDD